MAKQLIQGLVIDARTKRPLADLRVEAWYRDPRSDERLGTATTGAEGQFTIEFEIPPARALSERPMDIYFKVFRGEGLVEDTRSQMLWNPRDPNVRVIIPIRNAAGAAGVGNSASNVAFQVDGFVTTAAGVAVSDVRVEIWDQHLGGETLLATAVTDAKGNYAVHYDTANLGKPRADLMIRVIDPRGGAKGVELARSEVFYQADPLLSVRLTVDAAKVAQPNEYQRLLADVQLNLGRTALAQVDAKGVEYLAGRTGWDARLIAMAAQAAQLSAATKIPADHYYALMRMGLAGDAATLHRLPDTAVEKGLKLAMEGNVIGGDHPIGETLILYRQQSVAALRGFTPAAAVSSLGNMLAISLNAAQTAKFLEVYRATADRPAELWTTLASSGFDAATTARLQTDGKLGFLTRQNAPLVARLREKAKISAVEDLPRAGLYKADAWKELIGGDTPANMTVDSYAQGLAAQINVSLPTLVTAEMVRRGEIPVDPSPSGSEGEVAAFLRSSHLKHTIGVESVKRWEGYDKLTPRGKDGARLVERLYQMSPSNDSMVALHKLGLQSAMDIARIPRSRFLEKHSGAFPSQTEAKLVHMKAQEIHTTALNVATTYLSYRGAPSVYVIAGSTGKQVRSPRSATVGSPTLEELLNNMDYCACDECKSVLGAAAYFVELLQFINIPDLPGGSPNPQTVLFGRRPDLQDLLLTCENTNVALPYIDLINEILEHFIVNGSLAAFHGFNMREDSLTADLLADPEYVSDAAYDKTKSKVYPHTLPFDMPLAALRLLMQAWNTTLSDALGVFVSAAAARREGMNLNAAEYSILTDTGFRMLPEYFGEPPAATIDALNAAVSDGKTFSRRTEISYEDLVEILRTRSINPGYPLTPLLTLLQVSLAQIQSFFDGTLSAAAFQALLPPALDPALYGGDILQWLRNNRGLIMGLITLTDVSDGAVDCNFATVQLRFALPDNAANKLTEFAYQKLHRFIRIWEKFGWDIHFTDQVVTTFLGMAPEALTVANLDTAFTALLARIGNYLALVRRQSLSAKKLADWLPVFDTARTADVRQATLAHLLRIGTTDVAHFAEITGIDPLADDMATDSPSLLRFLDAWKTLRAAHLKVVDLDYLLRHRDDSGKLTPDESSLRRDLKALRDSIVAVSADLGPPPANADLAQARSKMALVYDAGVVDRFIGLLSGTTTYQSPLATVEEQLPAKITAVDPHIRLDPFGKQLTYSGILSSAAATALRTAADSLVLADVTVIQTQAGLNSFIADFKTAVQGLLDAGQADLTALDTNYHELKVIYDSVSVIADPAAQVIALINQVIPALRSRLQTIALRTGLTAILKTAPELVDVLTEGPQVMHAEGVAADGVLEDFRRLDDAAVLNANGTYALRVDPPSTDDYILYVVAPAGTVVTLAVDGVVAIPATALGPRGEIETAAVLALRAGALSALVLTLAGLPAGASAGLLWRTKGMAKTPIPAAKIYLDHKISAARASLLRLRKAALLLHAIPLTPHELRHLAATNVDTVGLLNDLNVSGTIAPAALHALWNKLAWVTWLSQIKAGEPDPDTWVGLLENPGQLTPQGHLVLAAAAGWTEADLNAVLAHFGLILSNLSALHLFRRVKEAVDFVVATGQTAVNIVAWTVEAPDGALIKAIKQSLRKHQDAQSWRTTLQSVNDALRNQRRDALVAYILHHQPPAPGVDTADKLYEYFLIDVEMDACMLTSRIRMALSTVQLFVTRCLMNLEIDVPASAINADQWAWMKRYRVWEANRKIFLYPENWLEPELRDNKSPFFRDLESELLKSDITDELAEDAYLSYLKKLDEVARLEVMGCYLQEGKTHNLDDDIIHVFGRTNGITHQYYYRRFESGYWTPWEKVNLNIEGDLLLPVIWKSQLFVFWVTAVHKPQGANSSKSPSDMATDKWTSSTKVTAEINLGWGEYYHGKWTSPKSSEFKDPIRLTDLDVFEPEKLVIAMRTEKPSPEVSERLIITALYLGQLQTFDTVLTSKNAAPAVIAGADPTLFWQVDVFNYVLLWEPQLSAAVDSNALREPGKTFTVRIGQPAGAAASTLDEDLLTKTGLMPDGFRVRPLMHPTVNQWDAPLFYSDERAVFFINPAERIDMVKDYQGYYWNDTPSLPLGKIKIPPLYETPVIKDPIGPVINPLTKLVNSNFERVITDNKQFAFGGATFDARGIAGKEVGR
jgi:hypothetical protein